MNYYLSLAALIPAVILFVRIYQLDRIEKEPRRLLGVLLASGALLALPAAGIQLFASRALAGALDKRSAAYLLLDNFLVVAVSEEVCKIVPVRLAAWKHPAFDYRFDAVVYSVSSALGFAAVENILYVVQSDLRTAVSRAVLSVPGHFFFAVAMGLLLSRGKQAEKKGTDAGRRSCARWRSSHRSYCTGSGTFCLLSAGRGRPPRSIASCLRFSSRRTAVCAALPRRTAACKGYVFGMAEQKPGGLRCSPPGSCIIMSISDAIASTSCGCACSVRNPAKSKCSS